MSSAFYPSRKELLRQLQALAQMVSTEAAMFHQAIAAKSGSGITDVKTMSTLLQEGPMTAGELAKRLGLTTGAVTNVIDRLNAAGFVGRALDQHDRRKVIVVPNRRKTAAVSKVYAPIGKSFEALFATYTDEQLAFLVEHYARSIEITRQEIARLAKNGKT